MGSTKEEGVSQIFWVEQLFRHSPLKREKFRYLRAFLPDQLEGLRLVDIGGDNGVISFKLRELGGEWSSLDLIEEAVASIRQVVRDRVYQLQNGKIPLPDQSADVLVVVDMLEHLENDHEFVLELHRVLKGDGHLIVNVPNPKEGLLRRLRFAIGQTDEKHGHVRPGYTQEALQRLLSPHFAITKATGYSRLCAQLVDTIINGGLALLRAGKKGKKGTLVTAETVQSSSSRSNLLALVGPVLSLMILLDRIFPCTHANMLIVKAARSADV